MSEAKITIKAYTGDFGPEMRPIWLENNKQREMALNYWATNEQIVVTLYSQ